MERSELRPKQFLQLIAQQFRRPSKPWAVDGEGFRLKPKTEKCSRVFTSTFKRNGVIGGISASNR